MKLPSGVYVIEVLRHPKLAVENAVFDEEFVFAPTFDGENVVRPSVCSLQRHLWGKHLWYKGQLKLI